MSLAGVIAEYKSDMICDLAETYHIYDYRRVPGRTLGTLIAGLREDSRIKKKLFGIRNEVPDIMILAKILDDVEILKWWQSKDGARGKNRPEMMTRWMLGISDEKYAQKDDMLLFKTGAEFDEYRARLMRTI